MKFISKNSKLNKLPVTLDDCNDSSLEHLDEFVEEKDIPDHDIHIDPKED